MQRRRRAGVNEVTAACGLAVKAFSAPSRETRPMQYMLFCCIDENHWDNLAARERDAVMDDYGAWMRRLEASGQHVASARLQPAAVAATLRVNGGQRSVMDGPFAETKEQIGGFHLIEAGSREEALAIAEGIPTLRVGGTIEVRALRPEATP
jgi:hypothetical protein